MDYPYANIISMVELYTGEVVSSEDSDYEAHVKILRCLSLMDKIIHDLVDNNPSCLLHPNNRVRQLAKEKT